MQNKLSTESYNPAEDTFFLEDHMKNERGNCALDIGSGSGYLTRVLSKSFSFVVGTDVNFDALKTQLNKTTNLVCCNASDALLMKFDLIVCNMPYLASDEILYIATDGGPEGVVIPMKIISSAKNCLKPGGKFLFVTSSLSNYKKIIEKTKKLGLEVEILDKKKLFFEELILVQAKNSI